jgi:geranylgeranyl pyrophosphate synthase
MKDVHEFLQAVSNRMYASVAETYLSQTSFDLRLLHGKQLRSRMAFHIGLNVSQAERIAVAAAVEMFHTASLLHDDVIDGARFRRGAPADWTRRGASASVLLGDRLIVQAILMLGGVPRTIERFLRMMGEVCDAELEHESLIGEDAPGLPQLLDIARRKTGSLFAFVGYACAGPEESLAAVLESCGYAAGAAYQFLDDTWDSTPFADPESNADASDRRRGKPTLAHPRFCAAQQRLVSDLDAATRRLCAWPAIESGWNSYLAEMRSLAGCVRAFG